MADDPWGKFVSAPAAISKDDPWGKFATPATPAPVEKPPPPDVTGGAYTYDKGDGWLAALHNFAVKTNNITREAQDAYTFGGLDAAQSLLPGSPSAKDLRAQTKASGEDVGPYAKIALDAVGRMANPLSVVGTGGVLSTAISGGAQEAAAAALHGDDPVTAGVGGALTGGIIGGVAKYPAAVSNFAGRWGFPAASGWVGSHFGPVAGGAAALAARAAAPAARPVVASSVYPWASPLANAGVQGALSGQQDLWSGY